MQHLRTDPIGVRIPMLILTSLTPPEVLRDARTGGAGEVLVISVGAGAGAVAQRLRSHLRQRRRD